MVSKADAQEQSRILRLVFGLCVELNVRLRTRWIPGKGNELLDALSRQDWGRVAVELQRFRVSAGFVAPSALVQRLHLL